jgi:hypothetical protein
MQNCANVSALLARFESVVIATAELPGGYAFRVPGDKKWMAVVGEVIEANLITGPYEQDGRASHVGGSFTFFRLVA